MQPLVGQLNYFRAQTLSTTSLISRGRIACAIRVSQRLFISSLRNSNGRSLRPTNACFNLRLTDKRRHPLSRSYWARLPNSLALVILPRLSIFCQGTCTGSWYGLSTGLQHHFHGQLDLTHSCEFSELELVLLVTRLPSPGFFKHPLRGAEPIHLRLMLPCVATFR